MQTELLLSSNHRVLPSGAAMNISTYFDCAVALLRPLGHYSLLHKLCDSLAPTPRSVGGLDGCLW